VFITASERTNERVSFLVAARETTIRSYGPGKLLRFGVPRERESDRNVKGSYRVPLPVSINVAGLFPDISRGCRAKIHLPLLLGTEIDRYRARGARSNGVRWSASANECRVDSVMKKKKQETRIEGQRRLS